MEERLDAECECAKLFNSRKEAFGEVVVRNIVPIIIQTFCKFSLLKKQFCRRSSMSNSFKNFNSFPKSLFE